MTWVNMIWSYINHYGCKAKYPKLPTYELLNTAINLTPSLSPFEIGIMRACLHLPTSFSIKWDFIKNLDQMCNYFKNLISMYWGYTKFLHRYLVIFYYIDFYTNIIKIIIMRWHYNIMWLNVYVEYFLLSVYNN